MASVVRWESFCPICEYALMPPGQICRVCTARMPKGKTGTAEGLHFQTLTTWDESQWRVRRWIYRQKRIFDPSIGRNLWRRWIAGRSPISPATMVVAAPGTHARSLAVTVASELQCFVCSPFIKRSGDKQAGRSQSERRQIGVELVEKLTHRGPFLLVDDVITTGSTAKSCHLALERPKDFQIWCLAVRPLLRRDSGFASMRR